jgi:dihydrofolate synthase / folylpolyglutamate synthase
MNFDLSRMVTLMSALQNPQNDFPSIHIAGTNGKGSVAAFISTALRQKKNRVGLYTSPHLVSLHERFQINGVPISDRDLIRWTSFLKKFIASSKSPVPDLTQFEFLTALAFLWFSEKKVDVAVIETGLGGRLDATNVISNVLVSVITNIELEHTQWLGKTREKIATEKAGIIKPWIPVVTGASGGAKRVIKAQATRMKAPLTIIGASSSIVKKIKPADYSLIGEHQQLNAALAYATLKHLPRSRFSLNESSIIRGLRNTKWPGRFDKRVIYANGHKKTVIFDGAHNPAAIRVLIRTLQQGNYPPVDLLFGVLKDKNQDEMVRQLAPFVEQVVTVPVSSSRRLSADTLSRHPFWKEKARAVSSVPKGWKILMTSNENRPIVVTGSLYLVGDVLKLIHEKKYR